MKKTKKLPIYDNGKDKTLPFDIRVEHHSKHFFLSEGFLFINTDRLTVERSKIIKFY